MGYKLGYYVLICLFGVLTGNSCFKGSKNGPERSGALDDYFSVRKQNIFKKWRGGNRMGAETL